MFCDHCAPAVFACEAIADCGQSSSQRYYKTNNSIIIRIHYRDQ